MNQMEIFSNQEFGSIRTFEQDGKVLFCGKDIAKALGYQRTADAITAHCKGVCVLPTPSNGGIQRMKFIPEGDVYRLIVHSKLPSAERFERWVFDEVLPSIRKHGAYITREKLWEVATSPEAMMKLCSDLLAEREKAEEAAPNVAPAPKPAAANPAPTTPKPQPKKVARSKSVEPKPSRDEMTFAQRMVTSKEPTGENEIPGMAPAQKIIIVLALIAFVIFMGYTILTSMGLL